MASSGVLKLVSMILIVCMTVMSAPKAAKAAITCSDVVNHLIPCSSYVQNGGTPAAACCSGVKALYGEAQTSPDRQNVCKCIKSAVNGIPYTSNNLNLAAGLPAKCGLQLPYSISPSTDCNNEVDDDDMEGVEEGSSSAR
ncbi:hypothetical protein GOBAR_AA35685 [Gossypium barbadense]|uniref:Non-specific lipid-transfer protein n=1 Tax=Gossypium barbadense TaxID=3634 RepID=A0A2P5W1P9_GOSBA|nr:hypothetical protein GOBAR_AA35685 [Gossypium barbadense]